MVLMAYVSTPHAFAIAPIIEDESKRGGVDPFLVAAIIQKESMFNSRACFRGAHGLMQVQVRSRSCSRRARRKVLHLYDPRKNIRLGISLMKWAKSYCRRKKHRRHHWLLHYNQGAYVKTRGKVGGYPRRVFRIYRKMRSIKKNYTAWNLVGH